MSRTSLDNLAIKAASVGPDLASLADGRYILPAFLPSPNCFMTIADAFEVFRETPLTGVRKEFGDSFGNVFRERLKCPWSAKGRVMRGLAERFGRDPDAILAEGVLLGVDEGWVLILPDPDSPLFYVYAETENGEGSPAEIMEEYVDLVKSLIEDQAMLSS
jgi:mannose-1-phosphate guanylyltransferase/phosphomannomutase